MNDSEVRNTSFPGSLLSMMPDDNEPTSSNTTDSSNAASFIDRLRVLKERRYKAKKENLAEVAKEDYEKTLPSNNENRKRRVEWEKRDFEERQKAGKEGRDYDREQLLQERADDLERKERKKRSKQNPDTGFGDFQQAHYRQYQRLMNEFKPDISEYNVLKANTNPDLLYPTRDTLLTDISDTTPPDAVRRMMDDVEKQIAKKKKFSRRRPFNAESNIDYINIRNKKFNEKAERFYGKYTKDIKQNLERGTAV